MKRAVIIGGTSGIGKAMARLLLQENWHVAISGIERDDLSGLKENFPGKVLIKYIDCSKEHCSAGIAQLAAENGGMDLLIFTAAIGHLNKDQGYEIQNQANKLNVLGFTEVLDWSYRYFIQQGHGHLVALSSFAGLFGFRGSPAYTAAKGYQVNYLEALIQKAHRCGLPVYVTDVRPGYVDTSISRELKTFWRASPEKAARQIFNAIHRKAKVVYVTKRWRLLAAVINMTPQWVRNRL